MAAPAPAAFAPGELAVVGSKVSAISSISA
jgi:hypothetical protein